MKSVKIDNHKVFNEFLKVYLECVAWLITPSALIFMKLYIICNVYQFFIAGFVLIGFFYFINLNKVILFCFNIWSVIRSIDSVMDEICFSWARTSFYKYYNMFDRAKFSIYNNCNYRYGPARFYSTSSNKDSEIDKEIIMNENSRENNLESKNGMDNYVSYDNSNVTKTINKIITKTNTNTNTNTKINLNKIKFNKKDVKFDIDNKVNKIVKALNKDKKLVLKGIDGGFKSYNKYNCVLGSLLDLEDLANFS